MLMIERIKQTKNRISGNGGFSIAELMVAFAVLMMLVFTTALLVTAASNTFTATNKLVTLQYRTQTVMAQLQQYFMAADGGVTKESVGATYQVVGSDGTNQDVPYNQSWYYITSKSEKKPVDGEEDAFYVGTLYAFVYDEHDEALYLVSAPVKEKNNTVSCEISGAAKQPLCSGVTAFDITTDSKPGNSNYSRQATSATISIDLTEQNKHYSAKQIFTFRNKPSFIIGPNTEASDTTKLQTLIKEVWPV